MSSRRELILAQVPALQRYARALLGNPQEAADLVQETLSRALGRWDLWLPGSDLRAWLFTLLHNQYVNQERRKAARPDRIPLDDQGLAVCAGREQTDRLCQQEDLDAALQRLPEGQRSALLLVALEGLSYRETARVLGIPQGTLMSRLHRARENLREWLETPEQPAHGKLRRIR